jgi:predicted enzyme related to lactoylglutathione lyase
MSLSSNPVVWFEIPVSDMQRAIEFYGEAFDVKLELMEMHGMHLAFFPKGREDQYGTGGALIHSPPIEPSHHGTTVYFHVPSIDPALEKIVKAGGKKLIGRTSIGEHGFIAQFEDSEGNRVALHEMMKK